MFLLKSVLESDLSSILLIFTWISFNSICNDCLWKKSDVYSFAMIVYQIMAEQRFSYSIAIFAQHNFIEFFLKQIMKMSLNGVEVIFFSNVSKEISRCPDSFILVLQIKNVSVIN